MGFDQETIDKVWSKGKPVPGKDPAKHRKDVYGNMMYRPSYGQSSSMGWEIDHIKPKSMGGSDHLRNLQPLNTGVNRSKGDSLKKKSRHSKSNK